MPYITSIERHEYRKGRQEGRQEGEMVMLKRLLTQRFGPGLPDEVERAVARRHGAGLGALADRVLDAQHWPRSIRDV